MEQEQQQTDVAKEPVDRNNDADFMDTGVLHEGRVCATCKDKPAARGLNVCLKCKQAAS